LKTARKALSPENVELSIGLHDISSRCRSRRSSIRQVGGGICSADVAMPSPCYTRLNELKPSTIDPCNLRKNHNRKERLPQKLALTSSLKVPTFPETAVEGGRTTRGCTRTRQLEIQPTDAPDITVIKHFTRRSLTLGMDIEGRTRHYQQSSTISKDDNLLTDFDDRISNRSGSKCKTKSQHSSMVPAPLRRPRVTRSTSMRAKSTASETRNDGAFFRGRSPTNQLLHHPDGFLDLPGDGMLSLRRAMASSSGTGNDGASFGRRSAPNELTRHSDGFLDLGTDNKASKMRAMSSVLDRGKDGALRRGKSPSNDLLRCCDGFLDLRADSKVSNTYNDTLENNEEDLCHPHNVHVARNASDSNRFHQPRQVTPHRPAHLTRSTSLRARSSSLGTGNDVALSRGRLQNKELSHQSDGFLDQRGAESAVALGAVRSRSVAKSRRPPARQSSLPVPVDNTKYRDFLFDPRKNRIRFFASSEGCETTVGPQVGKWSKDTAFDGQFDIDASMVGLARFWSITDPDDRETLL
jgi:hypothetical protein